MKALLDTNIIIHRENLQATNYSIGLLFKWLDKLHYEKLVHPYSLQELRKANNSTQQEIYNARLAAYMEMKSIAPQSKAFLDLLSDTPKTDNDRIDNQLLCEVYSGRADILITEDRRMRNKAERLRLTDKVFSINGFISKCNYDNPALIEYKALAVKPETIGNIDVSDAFFDSFRPDYENFEAWFAKKSNEDAYVCRSDDNRILGFLYLKTEDETENYSDITPSFTAKKRLKVGTFKVESTGFRLGERFIKIIFDNAIERHLDEIYVTLFEERPELKKLCETLMRWGFYQHGVKIHKDGRKETVLVKKLGLYDATKDVIYNFPNIAKNSARMILPIFPQYHTSLFPDSILNNEVDLIANVSHRYALQKVYVSWAPEQNIYPGDVIVFYRTGETQPKKYSSVITTIGIVDRVISSFKNEEDFLQHCQNRSVFSPEELKSFWNNHRYNLKVIKFVYAKSLTKRLTLDYLHKQGIVDPPSGPRPFTRLTNDQFDMILRDSQTELYM